MARAALTEVNRSRVRQGYSRDVQALLAHARVIEEVPGAVLGRVLARARCAARAGSEHSAVGVFGARMGAVSGPADRSRMRSRAVGDWHDC